MGQRSVDFLISRLRSNPEYTEQLKEDPIPTLEKLAREIKQANPPLPASHDKFTYRLAVSALAIVVLVVVGCVSMVFVSSMLYDKPVLASLTFPDILVAIGSTALGALASLLTPFGPHQ
ncbi:hypothetical protein [Mycoplana sp. MJR14]|uniref:hypothetical protein n=1 Tax=Mycoplana sp. MJR14 TaxID=3032583 RepID=UPI0023DC84D7|nr:hypothetical protein [Mycoplana sp. MJR14]MDF1634608.1 hypothetical protein [Mycoplana sp. MJR14]